MKQSELDEILQLHEAWLIDNKQGKQADLSYTDLSYLELSYQNLSYANLSYAILPYAKLRYTILRGADLHEAELDGSDLYGADFSGANMLDVSCSGTFALMMCPEEGAYIGWKKCRDELIVKLQITEDALRSSATSRKCRASKAVVLAIENIDGTNADVDYAVSIYDRTFKYVVGETVEVKDFDRDRWNECAPGIHHFITRQEAVDY